jgi:AcrR family transcriptional regulator
MTASAHRVGRDLTAQERRTAVLRTAIEVMATSGYDTLRLRDVAKAAGVSVGLLQHYFETRDELLTQAFRQASEDLLNDWAAAQAVESGPWERLDVLVSQLASREDLRTHSLVWVQFAIAASRQPSMYEGFRDIYDKWYGLVQLALEDGVAAGIFRPILPVQDVVEMILSHIDGCELNIASGAEAMTGERMRALTLRLAAALLNYSPA